MITEANVITIEKNIPIPDTYCGSGSTRYRFLQKMEVGDSFVINGNTPDFTPEGVRQHLYSQHSKNRGRRYTIRTIAGSFERPVAIRAWRLK